MVLLLVDVQRICRCVLHVALVAGVEETAASLFGWMDATKTRLHGAACARVYREGPGS